MAAAQNLTATLRSGNTAADSDLFILDTIGELIDFYALSDIAFVGGSLVMQGGHNPIEPALSGVPVIFGPNMQDFSEIADALQSAGGATVISNHSDLTELLRKLLSSPDVRAEQGLAARQCIGKRRGVIDKHLELISRIL
jgi:3-deoxy-D-manno-octulosonic-acid transferase